MSTTIQVRVDDELKQQSDSLFKALGTDTTSAIRMFLAQAVAVKGFPFAIRKVPYTPYTPMSEDELLKALEIARNHAEQGIYRDAEDVVSDLRTKYGL